MIYVSVGMNRPFPRLIKKIDDIAPRLNEEIVMQIGNDKYKPKNAKFFAFCESETQHEYIDSANLVIAHTSGAIMIDIAKHQKRAIFVPRQQQFKEAISNHQVEFANRLNINGNSVKIAYDLDELETALMGNYDEIPIPQTTTNSQLIQKLRQAIIDLCKD